MTQKAPGKAHRKGLTLMEIADMFRDEQAVRKWIEQEFWAGHRSAAADPDQTHRPRLNAPSSSPLGNDAVPGTPTVNQTVLPIRTTASFVHRLPCSRGD